MKIAHLMLASVLILAGVAASDEAFADRGRSGRPSHFSKSPGFARHGHFHKHNRARVFVGVPIFAPLLAPLPYYPPLPAAPAIYVERASEPPDPAQGASYWYYCQESQSYYPYVKECPGGWQQVGPQS
ncbi:MAG: hypothetical protein HYU75_17660, partial [Betaproteobacteria bacterium]|nr:hypothetical protein [Betaproteobacteria bacterium]